MQRKSDFIKFQLAPSLLQTDIWVLDFGWILPGSRPGEICLNRFYANSWITFTEEIWEEEDVKSFRHKTSLLASFLRFQISIDHSWSSKDGEPLVATEVRTLAKWMNEWCRVASRNLSLSEWERWRSGPEKWIQSGDRTAIRFLQ